MKETRYGSLVVGVDHGTGVDRVMLCFRAPRLVSAPSIVQLAVQMTAPELRSLADDLDDLADLAARETK